MILVVGLFCAMTIEPTRQLLEQRERLDEVAGDLQELQRINHGLQARIERLNDPDHVEQRAREIGLVRPGEVPFVVMPPSRSMADTRGRSPARPERPAAAESAGAFETFLRFVGL